MLFLNLRRSERAAALAEIMNEYDWYIPEGTHDTAMLKQCKSYLNDICEVVIFIATKSQPVWACTDILGVSWILPEMPKVCV